MQALYVCVIILLWKEVITGGVPENEFMTLNNIPAYNP